MFSSLQSLVQYPLSNAANRPAMDNTLLLQDTSGNRTEIVPHHMKAPLDILAPDVLTPCHAFSSPLLKHINVTTMLWTSRVIYNTVDLSRLSMDDFVKDGMVRDPFFYTLVFQGRRD